MRARSPSDLRTDARMAAALATSMLVRGVGITTGFGTPNDVVRSPVGADFFYFFYELMARVAPGLAAS